jgi:hypothetical protein
MAAGFNEYLSLNLLEVVSGLLIIGTILKTIDRYNKLTIGKFFILISGIIIFLRGILSIFEIFTNVPLEIMNAAVYLLFSFGITFYYTKKLGILNFEKD